MALKDRTKNTTTATETSTEENTTTAKNETTTKDVAVRKETTKALATGSASAFITDEGLVDAVADAEYGDFPSVVASNGTHMVAGDGGADLGKTIQFQAIVTKEVWKLIPGSNDDEAKEFFCSSYDGKTTTSGESIAQVLEDAHDAGYGKAKIKQYLDIICVITDCADEDYIDEVMTLQLAPTSLFSWKPLAKRCKVKARTGKLTTAPVMGDPELGTAVVFTSVATPTSFEGNNFTKMEFSL